MRSALWVKSEEALLKCHCEAILDEATRFYTADVEIRADCFVASLLEMTVEMFLLERNVRS